jgi:hypothetical protein
VELPKMSGIVTSGFEIIGTTNPLQPELLFLKIDGCGIDLGINI